MRSPTTIVAVITLLCLLVLETESFTYCADSSDDVSEQFEKGLAIVSIIAGAGKQIMGLQYVQEKFMVEVDDYKLYENIVGFFNFVQNFAKLNTQINRFTKEKCHADDIYDLDFVREALVIFENRKDITNSLSQFFGEPEILKALLHFDVEQTKALQKWKLILIQRRRCSWAFTEEPLDKIFCSSTLYKKPLCKAYLELEGMISKLQKMAAKLSAKESTCSSKKACKISEKILEALKIFEEEQCL